MSLRCYHQIQSYSKVLRVWTSHMNLRARRHSQPTKYLTTIFFPVAKPVSWKQWVSVLLDEIYNERMSCICNVSSIPRWRKFYLQDVIKGSVQYLLGKKYLVKLLGMENESLKPRLIYEWFWPDHFAGETKYREKLGRGKEGGEGVL